MSTHEHSRRAHELVDAIKDGYTPDRADVDFLRSFLPELPKQKTLEEITAHVYDAWLAASDYEFNGNEYDPDVTIEDWLLELHKQLKELKDTPAALMHPEFLETKADYTDVPEGTILTMDGLDTAWVKKFDGWASTGVSRERTSKELGYTRRRVLRWGWGK